MVSRVIKYSGRSFLIQVLFLIAFISLVIRLIYIHTFQEDFIKKKLDSKTLLKSSILAKRGKIVDRNNRLLALDVTSYTVIADLKKFKPTPDQFSLLSSTLFLDEKKKEKLISKKKGHIELARHIKENEKLELEELDIKGIFFKQNLQRTYPQLEISSHVVGLTDIDRNGIQGAEKALNRILQGEDGGFSGIKSPMGAIGGLRLEPREGKDLTLTIDIRLQSIAHHELKKAVLESGADSGSIVIIDPKSSEILALNNYPSFNPIDRRFIRDLNVLRNRATVDVFEPGSVLKPIAMAAIIDSGKTKKDIKIKTSPGWIEYGGYKTSDFRDYGTLNLSDIISYSSNVGMVKLCKEQDSDYLVDIYAGFGIGLIPANILIPAREGFLPDASSLSDRDKVSSCYGYGLSMTAIQIAQAYQVFANDGVLRELSLFKNKNLNNPKPEVRVISIETNKLVNKMLVSAVNSSYGTARKARVEGSLVAGKTGTAEKRIRGKVFYTASFSGFVPAQHPKLLAVIVLHGLYGEEHSGGSVAAPIFSKIMTQSLHALESGS